MGERARLTANTNPEMNPFTDKIVLGTAQITALELNPEREPQRYEKKGRVSSEQ